jgi:hypothetical protein
MEEWCIGMEGQVGVVVRIGDCKKLKLRSEESAKCKLENGGRNGKIVVGVLSGSCGRNRMLVLAV